MGQRVYVGSWRVRSLEALEAFVRRYFDVHGRGHRDRFRRKAWKLNAMAMILQFAIGLMFGVGLLLSGMSNPAKVLNFLDLAGIGSGSWDPSLALVMVSAIAVTFAGYRWILKRPRPLLAEEFHLPAKDELDSRVISGPIIFGVGWGLAGFCPGPALTALGLGSPSAAIFVAAMILGMLSARWLAKFPASSRFAPRWIPFEAVVQTIKRESALWTRIIRTSQNVFPAISGSFARIYPTPCRPFRRSRRPRPEMALWTRKPRN
jgi:uncharacterized membrane protein YedE/YeeE